MPTLVVPSVTPTAGEATSVATASEPVTVFPGGINGGFITNPASATATLWVNPVGAAGTAAGGTTFGLAPGQTWTAIPGQSTPTTANSLLTGHSFTAVFW